MKIYDLIPTDGQKSFYGKATVCIADDETETLYSYNTPIIKRTAAGELVRIWDGSRGACENLGRLERNNGATHYRILWNTQSRIHKFARDGLI